jgi:hypothetical protein
MHKLSLIRIGISSRQWASLLLCAACARDGTPGEFGMYETDAESPPQLTWDTGVPLSERQQADEACASMIKAFDSCTPVAPATCTGGPGNPHQVGYVAVMGIAEPWIIESLDGGAALQNAGKRYVCYTGEQPSLYQFACDGGVTFDPARCHEGTASLPRVAGVYEVSSSGSLVRRLGDGATSRGALVDVYGRNCTRFPEPIVALDEATAPFDRQPVVYTASQLWVPRLTLRATP